MIKKISKKEMLFMLQQLECMQLIYKKLEEIKKDIDKI